MWDVCLGCALGHCEECSKPDETNICCCPVGAAKVEPSKRGGPRKDGEEMADVLSTGRKRAALVAPIEADLPCEWRGLKFAGGGVQPIIGCNAGIASDRHHGPDKSVLNNEVGVNLHRICDYCHNRWHTLNDPAYGERPDGGEPFLPLTGECKPHDPETKATEEEIIKNDLWWFSKK